MQTPALQRNAANDSPFEPLAASDPLFIAWATRTASRLRNMAADASDGAIERIVQMEGRPSPEWAQALGFILTLAQVNRRRNGPVLPRLPRA